MLHGWQPGTEFAVEDAGDGVLLKPLKPFPRTKLQDVIGCSGYRGPRKSLVDMQAAVAEGARKIK